MISVAAAVVILAELDIEGLVSGGAPPTEYEPEACAIVRMVAALPSQDVRSVAGVVRAVWDEFFGPFSSDQLQSRTGAFSAAANRLVGTRSDP